ncbi:Flp family type IVb pilin [Hyphococcus lacteus]|uniref:Flp family type IVb pilin n=1 Tax=Hyphococcus lacteus TaxID=3143536 RepID=A0ABV3Z3E9_9PROT
MKTKEKKKRLRSGASNLIRSFRRNQDGATAIEYGLILAMLFLAIVGAIRSFATSNSAMYDRIDQTLADSSSN